MEWYLAVIKNYVGFKGRARRKEYWMFFLVNLIITFIVSLIGQAMKSSIPNSIYSIAIFLPSLAVGVRRLHDVGKSGIHFVLLYILGIAAMALMVVGTGIAAVKGTGTVLIVGIVLLIATLIYSIVMLVWFCKEGDAGANQYGENPKQLAA